jgi:HK97 family phage major capsid protein
MSLFTKKELQRYSVTKALAEMSNQHAPGFHSEGTTGLEREIHDTLAARMKDSGHTPNGFLLPLAALKSLNVTTATAGGFLVAEDLATITPALRAKSVVVSLGAKVFENLTGDLALPLESTTSQAQWLAELEQLTASDLTAYSKTVITPRRCACMTTLSRQLLAQDSVGIENFVRDSLLQTISTAIDKGALSGAGNEEPLGVLNMDGSSSVTFGGAATRAKAVVFQDALTTANAGNTPDASLAYVTSHATASKWMLAPEVTGGPQFLWSGNEWAGTVAGLPARATANVGTGNQVICGDWSRLVVGFWNSEAIQVLVDPYTRKESALVDVYATAFADVGVANPLNFAVSSDSGAQ